MLSARLAADLPWAPAGFEIAWDQFQLPTPVVASTCSAEETMPEVSLCETTETAAITGERFSLSFDKKTGEINSWSVDGRDIFIEPPRPNFWRAPTSNDRGNNMPVRLEPWRDAAVRRVTTGVAVEQTAPGTVRVRMVQRLPVNDACYTLVYTVHGSGDVIVEAALDIPEGAPELPRFGMRMALDAAFDTMTWFGRGPHETYWDRHAGAAVGRYCDKVERLIHPYVRPQENGNRTDVRWAALTDTRHVGLLAVGMPLLNVSAWPYAQEDLELASHDCLLPRRNRITLNLDLIQMGVGGDDSWGALPMDKYRLTDRRYAYRYRLTPLDGATDDYDVLAKRVFA